MESKEKIYVISFGDSSKYKMKFDGTIDELEKSPLIDGIKKRMVEYLKDKVPEGSHAKRFATPVIKEISPKDEKKYEGYPKFDESAIPEIEKTLLREVENMRSQKELSKNAPFGDDGIK